ncbi:threonine--tRNA ligase [Desulfitibacter alkalitolerans]|uniref:threonine--tRNA ligase n=1 Tax=Desulfitibacter alkalitolerans TaxID=264641 RepID=UPI000489DF05|nr:threonine--tRNA ligase [Desulfitibacter alkalitolerans]
MFEIVITLKDGTQAKYPSGSTPLQIAETLSKRLAKEAVVARFNGKIVDMDKPLHEDGSLEIFTFDTEEGKHCYRHSASHILAQAVQRLYPGTRLGIGPAIEDGYYYDFDSEHKFSPEDLEKIEKEMDKIIKENEKFTRKEISREDAIKLFKERGEDYKIELINDLPDDAVISIYEHGDWLDLCAGPHVATTGDIKAIKLLSLAGAYWRGSEKNPMLQRIYGTAFPKKKDLDGYLALIEEAKKRDHRRLGAQLGLFSIQEEGPGFPFFHPKGMVLRNQLEDFWRKEHKKWGYQEIKSPIILNKVLWEKSGHWEHYRENMYYTNIDENNFCVKPMNCPGAMLVYKSEQHSYREFPIRLAEMGLVHRHEKSGVLHGLMRVRAFTQDDAHIFMLPSQITSEIKNVIDLVDYFYETFGFEYSVELSTKPEKAMGSDEIWDKAICSLKQALEEKRINYKVNEGDGAFYGPKIDFHLRDSIGRTWQCGTIQLDFLMPEKFDLYYIGEDGGKHRPVVIHRVVFGSIERFIGILIEHYAGAFPLWLAPVQVKILPISETHGDYAAMVLKKLDNNGLRAEVDYRNEKIGYKIREAQMQKVPYMLVIGDKEVENREVSVRKRGAGDLGAQTLDDFVNEIVKESQMPKSTK